MDFAELLPTSLRVLNAVIHHETPAPEALRALREAAPDHANDSADELACWVINCEVKRRSAARDKAKATQA